MRRIWIDTVLPSGSQKLCGSGIVRAAVPEPLWPFYAKVASDAGITASWMDDASDDENMDVMMGKVVEKRESTEWDVAQLKADAPDGNPFTTAKAMLKKHADDYQAEINAYNPWGRHGTYYDDDLGWVEEGVKIA